MMTTTNLLRSLGSALALVGLVACGSTQDEADSANAAEAIRTDPDDLLACKKVVDGSGSIHIFRIRRATDEETRHWNKKVVAIGFSGKLNGDTVGYSQGDQPDLSSSKRDGDIYEMKFLKKSCARDCSNFMTTTDDRPGEDVGYEFIDVATLTIDTKKKTAKLEGAIPSFDQAAPKPFKVEYQNCVLDEDVIDGVHDKLK
jgi:hypothetical protein